MNRVSFSSRVLRTEMSSSICRVRLGTVLLDGQIESEVRQEVASLWL